MSKDHTAIEWTHRPGTIGETWNPTSGCDKIPEGCGLPRFDGDLAGGCYALTMAKRLKAMDSAKCQNDGDPRTSGPGFGLTIHPDTLTDPFEWRKPRTVFVNSMSDLGHARVPREFLAKVWAVMALTEQHTYQILSKRPERMARIVAGDGFRRAVAEASLEWARDPDLTWDCITGLAGEWPLPNCWMGTSIELNKYVSRADALRDTAAAVRFLSLEPLLGPLPSLDLTGIDQVIIGGESGPGSRAMDLGWVRELIAMARESGTAVFVKQLGTVWAGSGKGGDWSTWPEDLRIREFPAGRQAVSA